MYDTKKRWPSDKFKGESEGKFEIKLLNQISDSGDKNISRIVAYDDEAYDAAKKVRGDDKYNEGLIGVDPISFLIKFSKRSFQHVDI